MGLENKKELNKALKIDMNVRFTCVFASLIIIIIMKALGVDVSMIRVIVGLAAVFVFFIIYRLLLIFDLASISIKYLFNVFDVCLVTYAIDVAGGFGSPFYMMYFILPLAEALTHGNRKMILFTWFTPCFVYPAYIFLFSKMDITGENLGILITRITFLFAFGLISDYYQKIISSEKRKAKKANKEVQKMNQSLEMLVEIRTQELRNTQEQLIQSAKMAAVGQLAGGTAHELNNPLAVVLGHAQLLLKQYKETGETRQSLLEIEEHTKRCKGIILNLLGFSRQYSMKEEKFNIDDVINNAIAISGNQLKIKNIKIVKNFSKNVPPVKSNRDLLEQVFFNLIINAQHALSTGGTITIRTEFDKDNTVRIEVMDDGKGISREDLPKVFDPFFTTKNVGEGTGLGLFVTYSIIEKSRGKIRVESAGKGRGAKFIIELPRY